MKPNPFQQETKVKVATQTRVATTPAIVLVGLLSVLVLLISGAISGT